MPVGPPFSPPLYCQRADKVCQLLREHRCNSFIDAGCSNGTLLRRALASQLCEQTFSRVVAIDIDESSLHEAIHTVPPEPIMSPVAYLHPMKIEFIHGDLTKPSLFPLASSSSVSELLIPNVKQDDSLESEGITLQAITSSNKSDDCDSSNTPVPSQLFMLPFDALISIEVLEHIFPSDVQAYTDVIFLYLAAARGARTVIITTPNRDRNVPGCFESDDNDVLTANNNNIPSCSNHCSRLPYAMRHPDHKFEMTVAQFKIYCDYVLEAYRPYWTSYTIFGVGDHFTQGAVFHADSSLKSCAEISETRVPYSPSSTSSSFTVPSRRSAASFKSLEDGLTRCVGIHGSLNGGKISNTRSVIPLQYSVAERVRLFPYDALFGDLCKESVESSTLYSKPSSLVAYRCLAYVRVPHQPLWGRFQDALWKAFCTANQETKKPMLRFGDVMSDQRHQVINVLRASSFALIISLIKQERAWSLKATRGVRYAQDMHFILHWLLYKCWGHESVARCLENDTVDSASFLFSEEDIRIILFLTTVGVIFGTAEHLSTVLARGKWWVHYAPNRRNISLSTSKKHRAIIGEPQSHVVGGLAALPVNRLRLKRLNDALWDLRIPSDFTAW